jgi:hypothetical protein
MFSLRWAAVGVITGCALVSTGNLLGADDVEARAAIQSLLDNAWGNNLAARKAADEQGPVVATAAAGDFRGGYAP